VPLCLSLHWPSLNAPNFHTPKLERRSWPQHPTDYMSLSLGVSPSGATEEALGWGETGAVQQISLRLYQYGRSPPQACPASFFVSQRLKIFSNYQFLNCENLLP
ncbi:hypothetical protein Ancab_010327, partial [Ancistrocladus abbreviatus]